MKTTSKIIYILFAIVILASCKKGDDYKITAIELSLSKLKILDDNEDLIYLRVDDQNGNDVTSKVDIFVDDNLHMGTSIASAESGSMVVYAGYEDIVSNSETITVVEDLGLEYEKVILLEQFTGTWCGWCPRAITATHDVESSGEKVANVAYHISDPLSYSYNQGLAQSLNVPGYPTVAADRRFFWDLSTSQLSSWYGDVRTGFEVSYSGDGSSVEVIVDVSFGIVYTEDLKLSVYLIEDGMLADQANYYNDDISSPWYGLGSTVTDYNHDNVMRKTLTDMYGDMIPKVSVDIGSVYNQVFDGSAASLNDVNKSSAVVFVTYGSGINKNKVLNAIVCDYGETVESTLVD